MAITNYRFMDNGSWRYFESWEAAQSEAAMVGARFVERVVLSEHGSWVVVCESRVY